MNKVFHILVASICVLSLNSCAVGNYMCKYALKPENHGQDYDKSRENYAKRPELLEWRDSLAKAGVLKDTTMVDTDGFLLHAVYAPASDPAKANGTAIFIHGYTGNQYSAVGIMKAYRDELNYNIFIPELQYHGQSEGEAIQMGWLDRLDIEDWIKMAHNIWKDDFMVIHGVSMGGATTMMVSGEDLPEYVRAFIEDCGYTTVWDQFGHNLKQEFHLPSFPVLNSANIVCKHRYGWSFKEASSVAQLAKCDRPMLFIHGENDDFVPTADVYENYDAKVNGYKELWIAPGSAHARSFIDHREDYIGHMKSFLAKARELTK